MDSRQQSNGQVALAENHSALVILHEVLSAASKAFPGVFAEVELPADQKAFRHAYPDLLPRFEAARIAASQRLEIARCMNAALQHRITWQDAAGAKPLNIALQSKVETAELKQHAFGAQGGWQAGMVYQGERWEGSQLAALGERLVAQLMITADAGRVLGRLSDQVLADGILQLSGRKIAVLGGGAEMAPTRLWLECGADVLWLDTKPPPTSWWDMPGMSGRLFWPEANTDLLTRPQEALTNLIAFAEGAPVDLGLYAYAPGKARELRLTASMNAIVEAMPADLIRSVTMLVSPTTPTALSMAEQAAMQERLQKRKGWEAICGSLGLLGRGGGSAKCGDAAVTRTVVAIQGASYQAAQYLGKVLQAECWAQDGQLANNGQPLRVSANTAAITRTRSLAHPVFTAAFGGASAFGVETLVPRQSRRLNGLLAVSDWLAPDLPEPGLVRVHGGIHTLPYPLNSALRVAAAIGFARSPKLLTGLFSRPANA